MLMTYAQLRSLVFYWVDDQQGIETGVGGYFTNPQVNRFLNNALFEVQKQLIQAGEMFYLKTVETTTVANQQDYVVPTDFLILNRLELVTSGSSPNENKYEIPEMTLNQQDLLWETSGQPAVYVMKKNRISLFPIPDESNQTLRLYYSHRVAEMSADGDTPDVPEEYHEYIALLATKDCFIKDDRSPANLLEKIEKYTKMMKEASEDRTQDSSRRVKITGWNDGFGGMW
jgi:hypothetical protein